MRAGNSAKLIFETLKVVVGTRKRMPVNVKKLASTVVTLGGDYEVREGVWVSSSGHLDDGK